MNYVTSLKHASLAGVIFLLVSLPQVYGQSNSLLKEQGECPNYKSKLMHFVVFLALVVLALKFLAKVDKQWNELLGYALYAALLYFLVSSQEMYQLTHSLIGENVKMVEGSCPTLYGVAIHTVVFALCLASWQLYFPNENVMA